MKDSVEILIFGAGGHSSVVEEILRLSFEKPKLIFIDDALIDQAASKGRAFLLQSKVAEYLNESGALPYFHIAIGNNEIRQKLAHLAKKLKLDALSVVSPASFVSPSAKLGEGVFVGHGSVINAKSTIGDFAIINDNSVVEHHASVGQFSHIAPSAVLLGGSKVGQLSTVGSGAVVGPEVTLTDSVILGALSFANEDLLVPKKTAFGIPAKYRDS